MNALVQGRPRDPRIYQIAALTCLLLYGMIFLSFDISPGRALLLLGTALTAQYACTRIWKLRVCPREVSGGPCGPPGPLAVFESKSALISGLSLCLLLRTNLPLLAVLAAVITIASKFLIRWNGKHLFNPTNVGLVAMMLSTGAVWVSPGQWGSAAFFGFLTACAGLIVVQRAARADVTFAFLLTYAALLFARSLWLGEPLAIPFHRLQSGALLLFAFFMISDPKTTPDSRAGRVLFAVLVALGAAYVQFRLFRTNGLLWSLAFFSLFVPLIDLLLPGERYVWTRRPTLVRLPLKGVFHETARDVPVLFPRSSRGEPSSPRVLRLLRGQGGRKAL